SGERAVMPGATDTAVAVKLMAVSPEITPEPDGGPNTYPLFVGVTTYASPGRSPFNKKPPFVSVVTVLGMGPVMVTTTSLTPAASAVITRPTIENAPLPVKWYVDMFATVPDTCAGTKT